LGVVVGGLRAVRVGFAGWWGAGAGGGAVAGVLGMVLGLEVLGGDLTGDVERLGTVLGGVLALRGSGICHVNYGSFDVDEGGLPWGIGLWYRPVSCCGGGP